jgi:hypothetical protein
MAPLRRAVRSTPTFCSYPATEVVLTMAPRFLEMLCDRTTLPAPAGAAASINFVSRVEETGLPDGRSSRELKDSRGGRAADVRGERRRDLAWSAWGDLRLGQFSNAYGAYPENTESGSRGSSV